VTRTDTATRKATTAIVLAVGLFAGGARLPSLRDIQSALAVGQPKAQQVQAHFRALQVARGSPAAVRTGQARSAFPWRDHGRPPGGGSGRGLRQRGITC
jgi:hypothetical protein